MLKRSFIFSFLVLCAFAQQIDIARFRRVDDNIYVGHQPPPQGYAQLKQMGIKTVLDLRGGMIHKPHEEKEVKTAGMKYVSMRLSGFWEPHDSQMAAALAVLEDPSNTPVFIHCRRGDDRAGMVIACYHIAHDHWTNEQALTAARKDGLNILEVLMQRYIKHFDPSALPASSTASNR
jgi:tyrosine-protein phosphatase SIW14